MNLGNKISLHKSLTEVFERRFKAKIDHLLTWPVQRQLGLIRNEVAFYSCGTHVTVEKLRKWRLNYEIR